MRGQKAITNFLSRTIYFKILWAILVILKINPIVSRKTSPLFYFLLLYGAAIILYDFFTDKKALQNKYIVPIFLFFAFMGLSTIINYDKGLADNLKTFVTTAIQFMVIGRVDLKRSWKDIMNDMRIVSNVVIVGVTIVSLVSLCLLAFGINGFYELPSEDEVMEELIYYYGVGFGGRLVGIFPNPNSVGAFCSIALLCTLMNLVISSNKLAYKIVYIISMVINFLCIVLSGSRGALLPIYICVFILSFLLLVFKFAHKKNTVFKYIKIVLISIICVVLVYGSVEIIGSNMRKIPSFINAEKEAAFYNPDRIKLIGDDISLFKDSRDRTTIWLIGMNTAKKKPIFGVGKAKLYEYVTNNWSNSIIPPGMKRGSLHNIYLETLVAYGLPTLISLILLLYFVLADYVKAMISTKFSDKNRYYFGSFVLIVLLFIMGNNMFESIMLYHSNLPSFIFVLYLGYIMYFNQHDLSDNGDNIIYRYCKKLSNYMIDFYKHISHRFAL